MASTTSEQAFYIEKKEILDDSDDEFGYESVPIDDEFGASTIEEELDAAVRTIEEARGDEEAKISKISPRIGNVRTRPEVVDDFVRNFLVRMKMEKTLETFQWEWYELQQKGQLPQEDIKSLPDVYAQNENLDALVKFYKKEADKFKNAALRAKDEFVKLRKERDYHRMHHRRVVQERSRLAEDIKKLKSHYASYEPTLKQLKRKYETAMKEKMLSKLEKERALGKVTGLQNTLKHMEGSTEASEDGLQKLSLRQCNKGLEIEMDKNGMGPTQRSLIEAKAKRRSQKDVGLQDQANRHPNDTSFPKDSGINPLLVNAKNPPGHLTRTGGFRLTTTFQAHQQAISSLALHPRKQVLATASDDNSWKMWAVPSGEMIMTGEGHTDWISSLDFHPSGGKLATGSGDTTVKVWDFARAECVHTFAEHTHAVWGVSWHACGDFLATCSMDNTSKVWDLNSLRCRFTLRGHADSVNSIQFLPYSNTLLTSSADKTLSLWDARTGLCAQTFYGHAYSINNACFNLKGDTIASCDSFGNLKLFDVRTVAPLASADTGPHPSNHVTFDPSGALIAVSSNDATIKMYELASGKLTSLVGHDDAVQAAIFDRSGEFLVSGGSDLTVRLWS